MRLLIVQYLGDYRQVFKQLSSGKEETYHAQKYSVEAVAEIGNKIEEVATLCCLTPEPYNEKLENGVRVIGTGFKDKIDRKKLLQLVKEYQPTHLILRTPNIDILHWAIQKKLKTLAVLADSFTDQGFRNKIHNYKLVRLLNHPQIDWVANHGITASISLTHIGVNPDKIIPWDWPSPISPADFPPKHFPSNQKDWTIFYVGSLIEAKGLGDTITAIYQLKNQGISVQLKVAGKGDLEYFKKQVHSLNLEENIDFLGLVPNKSIVPLMQKADCVVVPSRKEYPEGFPKTIDEAFCSRTPIIASNHPMFMLKLIHEQNALIFPASQPQALANSIKTLMSSPELYQRLSLATNEAWKSLQVPVKWANLIHHWLFDSPEYQRWLLDHRLSSGQYPEYQ